MSFRTVKRPFVSLIALLAVTLGACASMAAATAVIALPNGYYVQPNKSKDLGIVKRGGRSVLPGPIAAYAVHRHVVTGALGAPPATARSYTNDLPYAGDESTRYFVLDTATGKLDTNLDAAAWKQRLEQLGAPANIRIYVAVSPE